MRASILSIKNSLKFPYHHHLAKKRPVRSCCYFSTTSSSPHLLPPFAPNKRTHIVFGSNTDVGKTIITSGLIESSLLYRSPSSNVSYLKPLAAGGSSDEDFITQAITPTLSTITSSKKRFKSRTLFRWDMAASPHIASRKETTVTTSTSANNNNNPSDGEVLKAVTDLLSEWCSSSSHPEEEEADIFVETAGGVLSPGPSSNENNLAKHANCRQSGKSGWSTQGDLYRGLGLPVLLVGDGKLGGISTTLSSLESLILRGYNVHAIVMLEEESGKHNAEAIKEYCDRKLRLRTADGRSLFQNVDDEIISLPPIPHISEPLTPWFSSHPVLEKFKKLNNVLSDKWKSDFNELENMRTSGADVVWWPFTQHGELRDDDDEEKKKMKVTMVDGAVGDYYTVMEKKKNGVYERQPLYDACASWWTQGLGHGETTLTLAAAAASGRYGHVLFPTILHSPAVSLSKKLLDPKYGPGKGWADRVFFSDDGSTAIEVAIKMGFKSFVKRRRGGDIIVDDDDDKSNKALTVLAQDDCYHGDTLGCMDVALPSVFNEKQHPWYESRGCFLPTPTVAYVDGKLHIICTEFDGEFMTTCRTVDDILNVKERLINEASLYNRYLSEIESRWDEHEANTGTTIGTAIIEPILMGAGGMKFVDPLYQRAIVDLSKQRNVPVVFDEIFSGLYRLGVSSCCEFLDIKPDIAAYGKLLTGGLVPMGITLASQDIFESFLGEEKSEALLHGHSYTGYPVGCAAALHALDSYRLLLEADGGGGKKKQYFDETDVWDLSNMPLVEEAFAIGTVLVIRLESLGGQGYDAIQSSLPVVKMLRERGVFARPLGNVVYIMVSPLTTEDECKRLSRELVDVLRHVARDD